MNNKDENDFESLDDFVKENFHLIMSFGVFAALTAYFKDLIPEGAVFSFLLTLIIGFEIYNNAILGDKESSLSLSFFRFSLISFIYNRCFYYRRKGKSIRFR